MKQQPDHSLNQHPDKSITAIIANGLGLPSLALLRTMVQQAWATGGLGLLMAALVLAVMATSLIGFSRETLLQATRQQAGQLLGGDLVVSAADPLPSVWQQAARQSGLRTTSVESFSGMVQHGEDFVLASVKAIEGGYPVRGVLRVTTEQGRAIAQTAPPTPGQVWIESTLAARLGVGLGDSLQLGMSTFRVSGEITRDSNRETGMSGFAPSLIMNLADVPATQVIQPGSRIEYRLLMAGTPAQVARFASSHPKLGSGLTLRRADEGNSRLMRPIQSLQDYAQIASLMVLILSGIALSLSSWRFVEQQRPVMALLRCLGADSRQLLWLCIGLAMLGWLVAVLVGTLLGMGAGYLVLSLIRQLVPMLELPFVPLQVMGPALTEGGVAAAVLLMGFGWPAARQLLQVPPTLVLRQQMALPGYSVLATSLIAWLVVLGYSISRSSQWQLGVVLVMGVSALLLLAFLLIWVVLLALRHYRQGRAMDLFQPRDARLLALQTAALALGVGLMSSVLLLRGDFLGQWEQQLGKETPNYFLYGVPPQDLAALEQRLQAKPWSVSPFYPSLRARLLTRNGLPFGAQAKRDNALQRELNLTMAAQLPANNALTAGKPLHRAGEASVEVGLAERLGIQVGDRLQFERPEGPLNVTVVNLRTVKWDSFQPNFFVILAPGTLDATAGSYLASMRVPANDAAQLPALIREFPAVLFLDIGAILSEIRDILGHAADALALLAVLVSASGLLVLLSSLRLQLVQRQRELALLRTLGVTRQQLRGQLLKELLTVGLISGVVGVAMGELISLVLSQRLELPVQWHPLWWLVGPTGMAILAMLAGALQLRSLWTMTPAQLWRRVLG